MKSDEDTSLGEKWEYNLENNGNGHVQAPGSPMRTAMMVLKETFSYKEFSPTWAENSIKQKGNYLIWITFNLTQGVAKLRIDRSIPYRDVCDCLPGRVSQRSRRRKRKREKRQERTLKRKGVTGACNRGRPIRLPFRLSVPPGDQLGEGV